MQRRIFLHSAATLAAFAFTAVAGVDEAHAQSRPVADFPSRPIRLLIAFPAGSPTDSVVRTLAGKAAGILGQPVLVENLPGAGGGLPLAQLLQASADGYTLAQLPVSVFRAPSAHATSHRKSGDDIVPVIHVSGYALGLSLAPDSPLLDWRHLGDWIRAWLGELVYGPGSAPLTPDLIAEKLGQQLQQKLRDGVASLSGSLPDQADAGNAPLRSRRDDDAEPQPSEPPTRQSLGLGLIQNEPLGIVAPRGTPPDVLKRLHDAFEQAMAQPFFRRSSPWHGAPPPAMGITGNTGARETFLSGTGRW